MATGMNLLHQAQSLHQAGRLQEAEGRYRQVLDADPQNTEVLNLLGILAFQAGNPDAAIEWITRAIAVRPIAESHYNLGIVFMQTGRLAESAEAYERALALRPDHAEAANNLGIVWTDLGRFKEGEAVCRRALALRPDYAEAHYNLGNALRCQGKLEEALACYCKAVEISPNVSMMHNNLGVVLADLDRLDEAEAAFLEALRCDPGNAETLNNLGVVQMERGAYGKAEETLLRGKDLAAGGAEIENSLGKLFMETARHEAAGSAFSRSLALGGGASAHSNALFCANFHAPAGPASYGAHLAWAKAHEGPAGPAHGNAPEAGRRLRVGYVSPDLRAHSVAFFLEPLLAAHDRDAVELFAYGRVARPDGVTARLRGRFDHWRAISGWDAARLADKVRADGIDLLVDLAGHTANNDLVAFGRKPAPVQLSWLGYPNTTGLAAMDYRLTDGLADPAGAEAHHREALLRLDGGFLCYRLAADLPPVGPLPMQASGQVTFGSFNQLAKLTDPVLAAWAGILRRVEGARLLLKARPLADAGVRAGLAARFAKLGIGEERLTLLGFAEDRAAHLAHYAAIDIALDPFPYNGATTSFEALAMGVPVLSLEGASHAGRVGVSILRRLGLDDWLAADADAYVAAAAAFAARPEALAALRASLRPRLAASPLTDSARFAREVEAAYRSVWKKWCRQAKKI